MDETEEKSGQSGDHPQKKVTLTGLAQIRTGLMSDLVNLAEKRNELSTRRTIAAEVRTELAEDRTKLAKEQTVYSVKSTEMAELRTNLSEKRTLLSERRTEMSKDRSDLALERTSLSDARTELARERNELATNRTNLSSYRSLLARGRTELALIRTGLAFVTIGVALMRYFGLGYWTFLDGGLIAIGGLSSVIGLKNFLNTTKHKRHFDKVLKYHLLLDLNVPANES